MFRKLAIGVGLVWLMGACVVMASPPQSAQLTKPVSTIGVLAFRPKPQTLKRWEPLVDYLNTQLPDTRFVLKAYTNEELDAATQANELEFILAQPSHYVRLTYRHNLSSPLATLHNLSEGVALDRFGGVIFTRSDRRDLQTLQDLAGQHIAAPSTMGLGGYQMQAYELLQAGVDPSKRATIIETGQPQDRVIKAVLSGEADAGFVRTGVIESLSTSGQLDLDALQILNPQAHPDFPFMSSTRLYPEWPFVAAAQTGRDRARRVAAALLALPHGGEIAQSMKISGFSIPGDYRTIDGLLRALRLPPFDAAPQMTLQEVWQRWQGIWVALLVVGVLVASTLTLMLYRRNRTLARTRDSLLEERARLSGLLEALPVPVWLKSRRGEILECNRSFAALFDRAKADLIGQSDRALFGAAMTRRLRAYDQECLHKDHQVMHEEWITPPDGQNRLFEIIKTPMRGPDGTAFGVLGIGRDTTLRHEHEKMLESFNQTLNDRVEEALAQKEEQQHALLAQSRVAAMGEMLSAMAHHWRQPLTTISLLAQDLKESYQLEELDSTLINESTEKITRLTHELSQTITDLGSFHSHRGGKKSADVRQEVEGVVRLLQPQLAMSHITLTHQCEPLATDATEPRALIDAFSLRQAIFNLILNARDAVLTHQKSDRHITIALHYRPQSVAIEIADSGGGIEPEIFDRIYEPVFTTKNRAQGSGVISGTGLGLYITKQIIEQQNSGTLSARNEAEGAVFTITLPHKPHKGESHG